MKNLEKLRKKWKNKAKAALIAAIALATILNIGPSDTAIRSKIVRLIGKYGTCSGEQVTAPSGVNYIITAAHCREIGPELTAITEDGRKLVRNIIAEDANSDLLLLEGIPGMKGLSIADDSSIHQHVRTFTHGHNLDTYKTEGALVQMKHIEIPIALADTPELAEVCTKAPKYKIEPLMIFFGAINVCMLSVDEIATTAQVEPGSSGGAAVDDSGRLIGVVSASGEGMGWLVPLKAIKAFLANY